MPCLLLAGCAGEFRASSDSTLKTPLVIWITPAAIPYGTALGVAQLNAVASVPGSFAYTPALGTILIVGAQTLSVSFTPTDTADYAASTASVQLVVNPSAPVLNWQTPAAISYGTPLTATQLDATASVPGSFTYAPASGAILHAGQANLLITFSPTDATDFTTATASVQLVVNPSTPALSWPTPAPISYGTPLSATQLSATAGPPGTFTYTPVQGTLLHAGAHTLSVSFTSTDTADYTAGTASVQLIVNPSAPVVSWPAPAAISYGTPLTATQLNATALIPGSFAYTPAPGSVLHAGQANLSVTFSPTDAIDFTTATGSVPLAVSPIPAVVTWPQPVAILYSTPLSATQLNATANVPGSFAYTPPVGAVIAAGSQTLSVTFTPADAVDYSAPRASVNLSVNRATPIVTWVPIDPIAVNVAIGASQLNATALAPGNLTPMAGSFLYTPAAGTTFTATGPQTLAVTFTPSDTEDYTTAEASITSNVSAFGVACWGDSGTAGNISKIDEGNYPSDLPDLILLPVQNLGVADQSSTQIGVREGGVHTTVTVAGGAIAASGGVAITFPVGYEPVNAAGPAGGITGTILGVHGRVTLDSGVFMFTRTTPGNSVDAPGAPSFVVDTPYAAYLPIFWEGQKNYSTPTQVLSDLAAQVATVAPGQTFLVLSLINYNAKNQWIGGSVYNQIIGLNNQFANIYGSHYLDTRAVLVSNYDPTQATDVSDFEHDEVPTSLRAALRTGTLANSIGPSDTSIEVNFNSSGTEAGNILTIDTGENAENVEVTAADGETVTVVRNYGGLNTSHSAGAPVLETDYIHPNGKGDQIIANAIAQVLSAYRQQAQQAEAFHRSPAP